MKYLLLVLLAVFVVIFGETVEFKKSSYIVCENNGDTSNACIGTDTASFILNVVLERSTTVGEAIVDYRVSPATRYAATIGIDYHINHAIILNNEAQITFADGEDSKNVEIVILNDELVEDPDESFSVELVSVRRDGCSTDCPSFGTNKQTTVLILDDNDGELSIAFVDHIPVHFASHRRLAIYEKQKYTTYFNGKN
eukprot:TRINITY_DN2598_c1_g3_i2.p1 TRINITY_DN2598_c1_g3~~TRINITY_DN2598_c1_g3_i2.p1  ORF type:complete len:197 (+),score=30.48 TRINITY_DN2598_c1_g3_i2:43-633(+)